MEFDLRFHLAFLAGVLVGVAAVRNDSHVVYLFVSTRYQGQGIARKLWDRLRNDCERRAGTRVFTLNAAEGAVPVYQRFGFVVDRDPARLRGKVVAVPMICYGASSSQRKGRPDKASRTDVSVAGESVRTVSETEAGGSAIVLGIVDANRIASRVFSGASAFPARWAMIMGKRGSVALGCVAWQDVSAAQASSATDCRRLEASWRRCRSGSLHDAPCSPMRHVLPWLAGLRAARARPGIRAVCVAWARAHNLATVPLESLLHARQAT
ncbi:GNAT family N-acetyltransferase [Dyella terrae]|uniref:GNAT family N-acetyltransferase n=1 Tax=Dyella terrae TaxID=522259 RepID=UPI001EFDDA47|nr:GNAT family N-acetyltransferase [Dyella terrae]